MLAYIAGTVLVLLVDAGFLLFDGALPGWPMTILIGAICGAAGFGTAKAIQS